MMKTLAARDVTLDGIAYRRVEALYGISDDFPGQKPYFTVRGSMWTSLRRRDPEVSGAIGEQLCVVFPQLYGIAALHLSDVDGVPLHAEANGWYFLRQCEPQRLPQDWTEANLTREQMAEAYLRAPSGHFDGVEDRADFARRVEALRPDWKRQADRVIAELGLEMS